MADRIIHKWNSIYTCIYFCGPEQNGVITNFYKNDSACYKRQYSLLTGDFFLGE